MSRLIQALESRMLLSATAASLGAETAAINTSALKVKADTKALVSGAKADLLTLSKNLSKSNVKLLKGTQTDETKSLKKISADVNALLKAMNATKISAADGNATIKAPTNPALSTKIGTDVTALLTVATKPQVALSTDTAAATTTLTADLATAAQAAGSSAFTAATTTAINHWKSLVATLNADANGFTNAVGALRVDLTTLLPVPTVNPSLVGDYKGTFKTSVAFGLVSLSVDFEIIITSQTKTTVTGSISAHGATASGTIDSSELSNGKVTLKLASSDLTVNLAGVVNVTTTKKGLPPGSVISGVGTVSVAGYSISGSFIVIKAT